jgi:hypothetical protein
VQEEFDMEQIDNNPNDIPIEQIQEILRAIRMIRYGSVEITIHASRIVQIERTEKLRFEGKKSVPSE